MTPPVAVGNDVVDLADPRCVGRASHPRFVERIFAPAEARAIEAAADPDLALWLRWAAKEAAFKVVSKLSGSPPPFRHAAFVSELEPMGSGAGGGPRLGGAGAGEAAEGDVLAGRVRHGTHEVSLRGRLTDEWLHVLAVPRGETFEGVEAGVARVGAEPWAETAPGADPSPRGRTATGAGGGEGVPHAAGELADPENPAAWDAFLDARFSAAERPSIHSLPSAVVRLRAREALCRRLGEEPDAVEIVCRGGPAGRTPPEVLVRGSPGRADVSLSHHGRWVGWALTVGE